MKTVCKENMCTGCMACVNSCPKNAISIVDNIATINAVVDTELCINCNLCEKVCPNISKRELKTPIFCKQGWAEDEIRKTSSSGGAASAIIKSFILSGGYVASCIFKDGEFGFEVTNDLEKARRFAGSKYVKSNPGSIYKDIKSVLKTGQKVLFVGLPCQSAVVQNYCGEELSDNLYTVDLICHGTPSSQILKQYIEEQGFDWNSISDIQFRNNDHFGLSKDGKRITPNRVTDSYLMAFLRSVDYTENCYSCRYATTERVSDITLGDAWGQMSDTSSEGVSLILCQTQKGIELVEGADIHLEEVDFDRAVEANHQLQHPSIKHPRREKFLNEIKRGHSVRKATFAAMPKESMKQSVKYGLIKAGVIKDSSNRGRLSEN